jgi:hypothetical protein
VRHFAQVRSTAGLSVTGMKNPGTYRYAQALGM